MANRLRFLSLGLAALLTTSQPPTSLTKDNTRVYYLGESHTDDESKRELIAEIPRLRERGITHIALEFFYDKDQIAIREYQEGKRKGEITALLSEWHNWSDNFEALTMAIIDTTKDNNIQIIAIDLPEQYIISPETSYMQRNQNWARVIQDTLKDPFAKVLLYCGEGHLTSNTSVNKMLADYGINSQPYQQTK